MKYKIKNLEEWLQIKTLRNYTEDELPEITWFNSDVKMNQFPIWNKQKKSEEFAQEIKEKFPKWVKSVRVNYLNNKLEELENRIGFYTEQIMKLQGCEWWHETLCTFIYEKNLKELFSRNRTINQEVYCWEKPRIENDKSITDDDIQAAKAVPITNFLVGEPAIKSYGKEIWKVPWRKDANASLHVYLKSNSYYDFARNVGGDSIDLVMRIYKIDFISAVKFILKI